MIELREFWVDGFGCLRTPGEPFRFERGRITLFLDDNEAGKTTLQAALLATLFGIEDDMRRVDTSLRPHKAHWAPLTGPPFGARLRLHDGRRPIELRWNFAAGELRVVDLANNRLITGELCPGADARALGQGLLGLTIEEFTKTCFVAQDDLWAVRSSEGLDALVQRAADTQAGQSTVADAQEALASVLRNYPGVMLKGPGLIENEIRRLEDETKALESELAELDRDRAAVAEQDAEFQRLAAEREDLRRDELRLDYLAHAAELEELRQQTEEAEKRRVALAALEAEREKLLWLRAFPADQADQLRQWQATRLGLLRGADEAERTIAELRNSALAPARRELDALGSLAHATQDDVDAATQLLGRVRDFETREQRHLDAIRREEAQLAAQGASIEELDRLEERFARLEPDDAEFLLDHERAAARDVAEAEEAKRLSAEATLRVDRILAERRRLLEVAHRQLVTGAIAAGVAIAIAGLAIVLHPLLAVALGVVGLGIGAALIARARHTRTGAETFQSDDLARARVELAQAEDRQGSLAGAQRARDDRLAALASHFGYEQSEVLVDDYTSLHDLRRSCGTLILLRSREQELAAERQDVEREVDARFRACGQERPAGTPLSRALTELQERMTASLRLRRRIEDLGHKLNEEVERHDALRREVETLTASIRGLCAAAGIDQAASVETAVNTFNERAQQYSRFRQLSDELIPQLSATVADAKAIEQWRADAERLHRAVTTMREEQPALVSLQVKESAREYRARRKEATDRQETLRSKADEAGRRVVDTLKRWHAERPHIEEALAERQAQLARARRHAAAIGLASRVLDEIGGEVHGRWAEELNRSAGALLQRIAPTLNDLKFDSRLSFRVSHRDLPEPVGGADAGPRLSAGAWDQLHLAVRLGLADFVARRSNGGLLVLDDPFAHFDDRRFEAAMRILAEFAHERHQVVLFSCQRNRFNALRSRDPQWFAANIGLRHIRPPNAR